MDKKVGVSEVGNAYVLQLLVDADGILEDRGKPVVILDTEGDAVLGKAVRDLFRARVRLPRKAKGGEAVPA